MPKKQPKIGLALGGGGARGLAHIGVLQVLEEAGIKIDYIVGVSMGAFMGACYSIGLPLNYLELEAKSFDKKRVMKELVDVNIPKRSILKGKKVYKYIDKLLYKSDFSEVKIPIKILATNLADGSSVIIDKGNLARAVEASICIPGVFPPVKIGDKYLIDGGVASPTPIEQAVDMGADIVIAVDLISKKPSKISDKFGIFFVMNQSYEIIRSKMSDYCVPGEKCNVVVVKPKFNGNGFANTFKFYDIEQFILSGREEARKMLPEILEKISSFEK